MSGSQPNRISAYTLRVDAEKLERLAEIAEAEHRTLAGEFRLMIDERIALAERQDETRSAA